MSDSPGENAQPPVVVWAVSPGDPPFRMVQVHGNIVGTARNMADVIVLARRAGVKNVDLEDPAVVRWVKGGMYTWDF
ncbi:hypothetical protein ABZW18_20060 [Streptomyces sp. NPDC004647]|uniref:hypothetical protein n=1 Tax=Streptomyces sp. NPDC004647 TaxID=3154671 RepID=UPI0033BB4EE9